MLGFFCFQENRSAVHSHEVPDSPSQKSSLGDSVEENVEANKQQRREKQANGQHSSDGPTPSEDTVEQSSAEEADEKETSSKEASNAPSSENMQHGEIELDDPSADEVQNNEHERCKKAGNIQQVQVVEAPSNQEESISQTDSGHEVQGNEQITSIKDAKMHPSSESDDILPKRKRQKRPEVMTSSSCDEPGPQQQINLVIAEAGDAPAKAPPVEHIEQQANYHNDSSDLGDLSLGELKVISIFWFGYCCFNATYLLVCIGSLWGFCIK